MPRRTALSITILFLILTRWGMKAMKELWCSWLINQRPLRLFPRNIALLRVSIRFLNHWLRSLYLGQKLNPYVWGGYVTAGLVDRGPLCPFKKNMSTSKQKWCLGNISGLKCHQIMQKCWWSLLCQWSLHHISRLQNCAKAWRLEPPNASWVENLLAYFKFTAVQTQGTADDWNPVTIDLDFCL